MKQASDAKAKRSNAKSPRRVSTPKRSAEEEALLKELATLLPLLDEECLTALVQSARNLAASLEEERHRASEYERFQQAVYDTFKPKPSGRGKKNTKAAGAAAAKSGSRGRVAGKASEAEKSAATAGLAIESTDDGRFFNIVIGGKWKLFNTEEMTALAKIALVKEPLEAVCPRIYAWLKRERSDMLSDFAIADSNSKRIRELVAAIRKKFKVVKK